MYVHVSNLRLGNNYDFMKEQVFTENHSVFK